MTAHKWKTDTRKTASGCAPQLFAIPGQVFHTRINQLRYKDMALLEVCVKRQLYGEIRTVGMDFYGFHRRQINAGFYGSRCVKVELYSPYCKVPSR